MDKAKVMFDSTLVDLQIPNRDDGRVIGGRRMIVLADSYTREIVREITYKRQPTLGPQGMTGVRGRRFARRPLPRRRRNRQI